MYYYQYEVTYKNHKGQVKTEIIRADNPAHLIKRFRKLHRKAGIIKYSPL